MINSYTHGFAVSWGCQLNNETYGSYIFIPEAIANEQTLKEATVTMLDNAFRSMAEITGTEELSLPLGGIQLRIGEHAIGANDQTDTDQT